MLLLSLIAREFRESARKKRAHALRISFGLAMTGWLGMLVFRNVFVGAEALGAAVYQAIVMPLNISAFLLAPALSAPAIATERAEGTLGLLFLTRLNPFHIVAAKFLARFLELFSFVLFALPFLVLPIVLGGVSQEMVFLDVVGLLNMLIFGMAVGLFASAFCRSTTRAFVLALAMLFLLEYWWMFAVGSDSGPGSPAEIIATFVEYAPGFGLFNVGPWFPGENPSRNDILLLAVLNLVIVILAAVILIALTAWKVARLAHPKPDSGWVGRMVRLRRWRRPANWVAVGIGAMAIWFSYGLDLAPAYSPFGLLFEWGAALGWMTKLILLVLLAHGLTEEKERGTLESVVCTPLSNAALLNRKIADAWSWIWGWYLLFNVPYVTFFTPFLSGGFDPQMDLRLAILGSLLLIVDTGLLISITCFFSAGARHARAAILASLAFWFTIALAADQLCLDSGGWIPSTLLGWSFRLSGFLPWRVNPANMTRAIALAATLTSVSAFFYLLTIRNFRRLVAR